MFRLSDILGKQKKEKTPPPVVPEASQPPAPLPPVEKEQMSVAGVFTSKYKTADAAHLQEFYSGAVIAAKQIYQLRATANYSAINTLTAEINSFLKNDADKGLLKLALADYQLAEGYLYQHAVNVCIITLHIGMHLGHEPSRLRELGVASLLHDIGLTRYLSLIGKQETFSKDEKKKVRDHPQQSVDILNNSIQGIEPVIIEAIYQEHERMDGSGYPRGLKEGAISEYAALIGVVDVYEALVHRRPYRNRQSFLGAVKIILAKKERFAYWAVKGLLDSVGLFPVGALVRLNTQELAVVIRHNEQSPLRPLVNIIIDSQGRDLREPKLSDLKENFMLHIKECVEE